MPKIKSRRQLLADRKRIENAKSAEREAQRLKDEALRLRSLSGGFSKATSTNSSASCQQISKNSVLTKKVFVRETPSYPSLVSVSNSPVKVKPRLSPEMEERERLARQETAVKRKQVAPHYSKGPYQYITEGIDLTTIGKKI